MTLATSESSGNDLASVTAGSPRLVSGSTETRTTVLTTPTPTRSARSSASATSRPTNARAPVSLQRPRASSRIRHDALPLRDDVPGAAGSLLAHRRLGLPERRVHAGR